MEVKGSAAKRKANETGFTLVELVIVIAIIGALIAIAIPAYGNWQENARVRAMQSDLRNTAGVVERIFVEESAYPQTLPPNAVVSPENTLTLSGERAATLPTMYRQYVLPGVGLNWQRARMVNPNGSVTEAKAIAFAFDGSSQTLRATVNCGRTRQASGGVFTCTQTSGAGSLGTGFTSTGAVPSSGGPFRLNVLCRSENGVIGLVQTPMFTQVNPLTRPAGYVQDSPQQYTTPVVTGPVCGSLTREAVAFSFNGLGTSGEWQVAWGRFAGASGEENSYCIEATSARTEQVWSYRKEGGLTEGAC